MGRVSGNEPEMGTKPGRADMWGNYGRGASKDGKDCKKEPNRFRFVGESGGQSSP